MPSPCASWALNPHEHLVDGLPDPSALSHKATPGLPQSWAGPPLHRQSRGTLLGFKSPSWCLMSAFVTALGIFNLRLFPPVSVFTFLTLPPGQVSAQLPWCGVFLQPSSLGCLPQAGRLRGDGASPPPADPGGGCFAWTCLAESSLLSETEVGCGGGSKASPLLWGGCALRSRVDSCRHRVTLRPDPPTPTLPGPWGPPLGMRRLYV